MELRSTHDLEESKNYLLTLPEARVALRIIAFASLVNLVVIYQLQPNSVVWGLFGSGLMLVLSGLGQAHSKLTRPFSFLLATVFPVVFGFVIVNNGTVPFPFAIFGAALVMVLVKKQYSPYLAVAILTPPFAYVVVYPEALTPLVSRVLLVSPTLAFAFYFLLTRVYRRSHELSELVDQLESANHEKQQFLNAKKKCLPWSGTNCARQWRPWRWWPKTVILRMPPLANIWNPSLATCCLSLKTCVWW